MKDNWANDLPHALDLLAQFSEDISQRSSVSCYKDVYTKNYS